MRLEGRQRVVVLTVINFFLVCHVKAVITHVFKRVSLGSPRSPSGHQRAALLGLRNRVGVESDELFHFLGSNIFKATGFESQVMHIVLL